MFKNRLPIILLTFMLIFPVSLIATFSNCKAWLCLYIPFIICLTTWLDNASKGIILGNNKYAYLFFLTVVIIKLKQILFPYIFAGILIIFGLNSFWIDKFLKNKYSVNIYERLTRKGLNLFPSKTTQGDPSGNRRNPLRNTRLSRTQPGASGVHKSGASKTIQSTSHQASLIKKYDTNPPALPGKKYNTIPPALPGKKYNTIPPALPARATQSQPVLPAVPARTTQFPPVLPVPTRTTQSQPVLPAPARTTQSLPVLAPAPARTTQYPPVLAPVPARTTQSQPVTSAVPATATQSQPITPAGTARVSVNQLLNRTQSPPVPPLRGSAVMPRPLPPIHVPGAHVNPPLEPIARQKHPVFGHYYKNYFAQMHYTNYIENKSGREMLLDLDDTIYKLSQANCYASIEHKNTSVIKAMAIKYGYSAQVSEALSGLGNREEINTLQNPLLGNSFSSGNRRLVGAEMVRVRALLVRDI